MASRFAELADSDEVTRDWRQLRSSDLLNLYSSPMMMMMMMIQ
jgi:hypothetical protein